MKPKAKPARPYAAALYPALLDAKWKLKARHHLTDDQAARLAAIQAELDTRDAETERRRQDAKLSAAWDKYLFDKTA